MPDKGFHLIIFGGAFFHISAGNGAMPLNLRPKHRPKFVFFVLYKYHVVCVFYRRVACVLYFPYCM